MNGRSGDVFSLVQTRQRGVHARTEEVLGEEKAAELRELLDEMASQGFARRFL